MSEGGEADEIAERDLMCIFKAAFFGDWTLNHKSGELKALLRFEDAGDLGLRLGLRLGVLSGEGDIYLDWGLGFFTSPFLCLLLLISNLHHCATSFTTLRLLFIPRPL